MFEATAAAGRAAHFHFGQEMHFDGQGARAFATFTAPTRDVERKITRRYLVLYGFGRGSKGFTNRRERVGIGGGVRARDTRKVLLVNRDDLIDMFPACDGIV